MSDDSGDGRDHEKAGKDRENLRRRTPMTEPSQGLRETPPSGAGLSEGEEVWLNGKDAQVEPTKRRSWWRGVFGG
jgi:hypothetical protein